MSLKILSELKIKSKLKSLPFYKDGHWWVQGLSSSLPVYLINKIFKKDDKKKKRF